MSKKLERMVAFITSLPFPKWTGSQAMVTLEKMDPS